MLDDTLSRLLDESTALRRANIVVIEDIHRSVESYRRCIAEAAAALVIAREELRAANVVVSNVVGRRPVEEQHGE